MSGIYQKAALGTGNAILMSIGVESASCRDARLGRRLWEREQDRAGGLEIDATLAALV